MSIRVCICIYIYILNLNDEKLLKFIIIHNSVGNAIKVYTTLA